jgi:uracil-DNA glycosylase family 4
MGFFGLVPTARTSIATKTAPTNDLLHRLKCKICPLDKADHLRTPKMEPSGSNDPVVYIMGEAPGKTEDKEGLQFVGAAGELLRPNIPAKFKKRIRWNNTIRCRPSTDNRDPDKMEVECCRPFIEQDIEQYKPVAIFGMGAVPLSWTGRGGGIHLWRGRRFPIRVGTHVCWYYPMLHPAGLLHNQKGGRNGKTFPSDDEFAFKLDLKRAFAEVEAGLPEPEVHTAKFARQNITCINGRKEGDLTYVLDFLEYAGNQDVAGVDYETQNKRPYYKNSEILTAAVSVEDETVAFAFRHKEAGWTGSDLRKLDKAWVKFLYSRAKKAVHQLSFESEWSAFYYGVELVRGPPWECTMTQAYVLDERVGDIKPGALSLEFISLQHFGINIKALSPKMNKEKMANERLDVLLPYNGIDAKYHRFNYIIQKKRLKADGTLKVYREKVRQVPTVVLTQLKGINIDGKVTAELRAEYEKKLERVEAKIQEIPEVREFYKKTRQQFNPGSVQDIIVMLRDIIGTREGQPGDGWSTREEVLSQIDNPVCAAILEYRKIVKIKSTYIDPYSPGSEVLYPGNVIHTNLGTCFTETGRLQSDDPNIQNIPTRTEEGKKVRKQFASKVVLSVDYGQIDARIIACGSRDRNYCKALWENYDIHMEWAKRLAYKFPQFVGGKKFLKDEEMLGKFREKVKNKWVFALFYGASIRKTAQRFGVEISEIMDLYEAFWNQFADVKVWQQAIISQFQELGYVQLFEGLRRHAPLGYGQIINTPVQGATNRIVMLGMNRLSEIEVPYGIRWGGRDVDPKDLLLQANMQIHDDLTFMFNSVRDYEDSLPKILDIMLDGREFDWFCVPLVAEVKQGPTWAEQKKVGDFSSVERLGWPIRSKEFM